jgi:hypothetical protein
MTVFAAVRCLFVQQQDVSINMQLASRAGTLREQTVSSTHRLGLVP